MLALHSRLRFRTKLLASYVALGATITLVGLVGARTIEARADRQVAARTELIRRTWEISSQANSAAEQAFSFVIAGDADERVRSLDKIEAATSGLRDFDSQDGKTADEALTIKSLLLRAGELRLAADAMFEGFGSQRGVPHPEYERFETALDELLVTLVRFRDDVRAENARVRERAETAATWLTVLVAIAGVALTFVSGHLLSRRLTGGLLALRENVRAFHGAPGTPRLPGFTVTRDEIDDLVAAFDEMTITVEAQLEIIRGAQERLEDVFASIGDVLVVADARGVVIDVNPACCRAFGQSKLALVGQSVTALFISSEETAERAWPLPGAPPVVGAAHDLRIVAADGHRIPFRLNVARLRGRDHPGWVCVGENLTEKRRLESEARQAQKMEAVGRLAGGVAHDFNNMLSVILGYAELLLDGLEPTDATYEPLREMQHAGERSADLTRQLLAFSRQTAIQTQTVDVRVGVRNTAKMLQRLLGEDIETVVTEEAQPGFIEIAPGQIEQTLMNLAVNARDAMPSGGRLTLETRSVTLSPSDAARYNGVQPGRFVVLTVSDTGTGMDAQTKEHIFEPFFTTKEQGKGTGLGLSTVFGIVRACGGHLEVQSRLGHGTTFQLFFPAKRGSDAELAPASLAPSALDHGATILLVEDDAPVRALIERMLLNEGYRVLSASDAGAALAIWREASFRIDMLLTDMVMPGLRGNDLASQLRRDRPSLRVLFMSGYTDGLMLPALGRENGSAFVQKPVTAGQLTRGIDDLLRAVVPPSS